MSMGVGGIYGPADPLGLGMSIKPMRRGTSALLGAEERVNVPSAFDLANPAPYLQAMPGSVADVRAMGGQGPAFSAPQMPAAAPARRGMFANGGRAIIGAIGDALLQAGGAQPIYAPAMGRRRMEERQAAQQQALWGREDANRLQDHQWSVEAERAKREAPDYFMSGRDRVRFDPTTGQSTVVYDGREDYQNYADALGMNPGDPGYRAAVQDYVLRGSGPTAMDARSDLEGMRQQNRMQLRATPTYANLHPAPSRARGMAFQGSRTPTTMSGVVAPILAKISSGKPLSAGEQQALATYQAGRGGGRGRGGTAGIGAPATASVPIVRSPAEARALPPGTRFRTPDGREMVR